jgi:hypothetical protein
MNINRESKKNEAVLVYNDEKFIIWQDKVSKWYFSYGNLSEVSTGQSELQLALNVIHETINEQIDFSKKTRRS